MSAKKIAFISLIVASILWASSGTLAKILLPVIDPIPLMMLRIGISLLVLIPLFLLKPHPPLVSMMKDSWPMMIAAAGNLFFFIIGVSTTTANAAAIIYTVSPLVTILFAKVKIQEYNSPRKLFGVTLGFLGVVLIVILPILNHGQSFNGDPLGNIFILCGVASWTYYIVSSRELITKKHYEPITVTTLAMAGSFLMFLLLTIVIPHRPFISVALTGTTPFILFFYGIIVTAITFLLHQWAIKHSSATTASLTNYLQPVFAFAYNAYFIGEKLTIEFLLGSILVLMGTILATSEQTSIYMKGFRSNRRK
jgi:drug/metabolite transporter (DMT)-like permease